MPNYNFDRLVAPAVNAVLETMFFSVPLGRSEPDTGAANLEARVSFFGEVSGILGVRISEAGARSLAASFLGEFEESLSDPQTAQVVCELTNMLCGWIVSNLASQGCFDLGSPELFSAQSEPPLGMPDFEQSFAIENGTLTISLYASVPA
ncbi:MAG TPA: chemotaxis protein CheX [Terracidiphilus sp.]|jgi:CheY-specific phosphatase CheX